MTVVAPANEREYFRSCTSGELFWGSAGTDHQSRLNWARGVPREISRPQMHLPGGGSRA